MADSKFAQHKPHAGNASWKVGRGGKKHYVFGRVHQKKKKKGMPIYRPQSREIMHLVVSVHLSVRPSISECSHA